MKKIILGSLLGINLLVAEVTTVLPYFGSINYDSSSSKSAKDSSQIGGLYASIGDLSYLFEMDYSYIDTTYKDSSVDNLNQYDITLMYSKYSEAFMIKGGLHNISTNDVDLGNGITLIAALGSYKYVNDDKYSYGVEGYYSYYSDGHDEDYAKKIVSIIQVTPYFGFFHLIDKDSKNSIDLKLNYIIANNYKEENYTSYEISDTYYHKNLFTTIKVSFGEMRSGVKDGGLTVHNTLDLMKNGYSLNVGYYITKNIIVDVGYAVNTFEEYGKAEDGTSSVSIATLRYGF